MSIGAWVPRSAAALLTVLLLVLCLSAMAGGASAAGSANLALNPEQTGYPEVTASYTCGCDSVWSTVNGIHAFGDSPRDRWTNYGSPNASDWLAVDFGTDRSFNEVRLYLYNDGGGVQPPADIQVQYWFVDHWEDAANPAHTPETPEAAVNGAATTETTLNRVNFDTVESSKVRVILANGAAYSGVVELEVYLAVSEADEAAANSVTAAIAQLPDPADVALTDQPAIASARAAYEGLSAVSRELVANLARLSEAEAALEALEASLADVAVLSAYRNEAGDTIMLKLASPLDTTHPVQAEQFIIDAGGTQLAAAEAGYEPADGSGRTIRLVFAPPLPPAEAPVVLSAASGALKTAAGRINLAISELPVISFQELDLTLDHRIGVDDLARIIGSPELQIDVNRDSVFDRADVRSLLSQLTVSAE